MIREELVTLFQQECEQDVGVSIKGAPSPLIDLRLRLLYEEVQELDDAIYLYESSNSASRLADVLKEMADVQYVLSGLAATFDLPLEAAFRRVHNSNMTKVIPLVKDGGGKVLKGPNYAAPNLIDLAEDYLANMERPNARI